MPITFTHLAEDAPINVRDRGKTIEDIRRMVVNCFMKGEKHIGKPI